MQEPFDELSKALAGGISRREAFRRAGGLLVGAVAASLGLDRLAWAVPGECARECRRVFPGGGDAQRACIYDCDQCKKACGPPLHGVCTDECRVACRPDCVKLGYPAGDELDFCVHVCAVCKAQQRGLCQDPQQGNAAVCCCEHGKKDCGDKAPGPKSQAHCCTRRSECCGNSHCCNPQSTQGVSKCCPSADGSSMLCVNTSLDEKNCGDCGHVCEPRQICAHGRCVNKCAADETACVAPETHRFQACCVRGEECLNGRCLTNKGCPPDTTPCLDDQGSARGCCESGQFCDLGWCKTQPLCAPDWTFCGAPTTLWAAGGDECCPPRYPDFPSFENCQCCPWLFGKVVTTPYNSSRLPTSIPPAPDSLTCCYGPNPMDPTTPPTACRSDESCCWAQFVFNGKTVTEVSCCPPNDQFHTYECHHDSGCVATPV
jgi:hypothetical protein